MKRKPILPKSTKIIYINKWYNPIVRWFVYIVIVSVVTLTATSYRVANNITAQTHLTETAYATIINLHAQTIVAEMTSTASYIALHPTPTATITFQPPPTKTQTSCPSAPKPHVSIGQNVTVLVENFDKLKLRSEPRISPETEVMELDKNTKLVILDGPECVPGSENSMYWFWKVKVISNNKVGWVAEGEFSHYYID